MEDGRPLTRHRPLGNRIRHRSQSRGEGGTKPIWGSEFLTAEGTECTEGRDLESVLSAICGSQLPESPATESLVSLSLCG